MQGFAVHLIYFPNKLNQYNNTDTQMQDSIYHMVLKSLSFVIFKSKHQDFAIRKHNVFMEVNA